MTEKMSTVMAIRELQKRRKMDTLAKDEMAELLKKARAHILALHEQLGSQQAMPDDSADAPTEAMTVAITAKLIELGYENAATRERINWEVGDRVMWAHESACDFGVVKVVHRGTKAVTVRWLVANKLERVYARKLKPQLCETDEKGNPCGERLRECPSGLVCKNGHGQ